MDKSEFRIDNAYHYNRKSAFAWIVSHLLRYPFIPIIVSIVSVINNLAYSSIQLFIGSAISIISQAEWELKSLLYPVFMLALISVIQALTGLSRNFSFEFMAQRIERNAREELYTSLLGKSQSFHGSQRIGDIMARSTYDVQNLNWMFNPGLMLIIDSGLGFILPVMLIGILNLQLLVVPGIFTVLLAITVWDYNRRLRPVSEQQEEQYSIMNSGLTEAIEGIEVVKSNVREDFEISRFTENAAGFRDCAVKQGLIQAKYWPMLVFAVCWGAAIFHALFMWKNNMIDIAKAIAFIGLFGNLRYTTFISLFSFNLVQLGFASAGRILSLINAKSEIDENQAGIKKTITGKVEFRMAGFTYHEKKVLEDVSFTANPGETVAIVGQTGSGKTTLTRLINRIFDASEGHVLIDDADVRAWNMESLRSQISTIEQDIFLYSATVRENIAFGRQSATFEEIRQAAEHAQADQFISRFRDGYETIIGERGVTLSGGQKQRIAIARAFLSDPKILILDDSTSAIDSATEDEIQKAMKRISESRTTFIITHRLSQIRWADRIIVLKAGRIFDQGTHAELMNRCTLYQKIFS